MAFFLYYILYASWKDIIATAAVITTILQFLSGTLICQKIVQKGTTGETSGLTFICGFLSCSLWLRYAFLNNEPSLLLVNTVGVTLQLAYVVVYYVYSLNKSRVIKQFLMACLLILGTLYYTMREPVLEKAIMFTGMLCCCITIMFVAAPLTMLAHVIRVKSTECLPFPIILMSFFVSGLWFLFGLLIQDTFVQIPNLLGLILSSAQLVLFVKYPSSAKQRYTSLITQE